MRTFWIIFSFALLVSFLAPSSTAFAQGYSQQGYGQPGYGQQQQGNDGYGFRRRVVTVAWIIANRDNLNADDRWVTIVGTVLRPTGDESYWFTDGTGRIRLDSENFELPIGRKIIIGGKIDEAYFGIGHLEVDVRRWRPAPVNAPSPGRS